MTAFLTIDAYEDVTIPVALGTAKYRLAEVPSESVRLAFSGVPRSSLRTRVRVWEGVETQWITTAQETEIVTALEATPPIAITGRMAGSVNVVPANIKRVEENMLIVDGTATDVVRISFDLWEIPA
jgi:hypothetical protein